MLPSLAAHAAVNHGVFTRRQALEAGYTAREIDVAVRTGRWVALRRGAYVTAERAETWSGDRRARHLAHAAAAFAVLSVPAVMSHRSAALAWRLPLLGGIPPVASLTTERQHRRRLPSLEMHTAVTPIHHTAVVEGLRVTSVARTLSDLARCLTLPAATVVADAALHAGLCTVLDLERVVSDCPVWPGIARTKRLLSSVDRRSESPGETLSRLAIAAAGLPVPEPQVELLLGGRRARVDFMWAEHRVVGEFDGRVKYGSPDDLWQEKQREDAIRRQGYDVVRWVWSEVHPDPDRMVERLRRALARRRVVEP